VCLRPDCDVIFRWYVKLLKCKRRQGNKGTREQEELGASELRYVLPSSRGAPATGPVSVRLERCCHLVEERLSTVSCDYPPEIRYYKPLLVQSQDDSSKE